MASQEEDNKLECISNVNKDQERYFLNVYKKHEYILNNKNETFKNKIESLIEVWKSVGELNLSQFDIRHVIQIMDWAKLHALNIVLTAEWNKFKASYQSTLLQEIEKAQNELLKLNSAFATRCKKLSDVVRNPWEDPVLMTLMKTKDSEIGPEEIEFFCVETAYIVSVRLKKLCESHCEDLALNLVTAFMNCNKLSKSQNFSLNATETQMWFIFDIYIALLYKFQEKQKIVVLLKELTFEEGLQLVKRFAKKRVKISKIWKNCQRVAILATQMYISQAVVKYTEELKEFLESYLEIYISLCSTESLMQEFPTCIRRISNLADAAGLYVFCDVIRKKAGTEMKPLVVEMYIRALTTDMNELERQKDGNETEKATATTSRLAEAFCNLANFLDEHVKVARECVLTAFSLEPTKERLENIITLARRSGFQVLDTGQEWKCKLHPPALPTDDVTWICPECGEWMCKPDFTAPIKINMALNEALQNSVLGISEALCDDLVVCLSNPRYQILSWFLPWADLHRLCIMYLQDSQTTKNFVTELKFVDIDYSIFKGIKREPMDEMAGIERGYEQYLDHDFVSDNDSSSNSEDSMSQDSRPYSLGSDGAGEGPYLPMLPPQTKSDPKTLKSLRMFRPSLKRTRDKGPEEGTPEKLYKTDSNNASDSCTIISNAENKSKTENNNSLNKYLTSVTPKDLSAIQYPQLSAVQYPLSSISLTDKSSNKEVSHSKNVKTATLPLLGGQVAKKEFTTIQVNKQLNPSLPKKGRPSLLINLVQTVIPQNLLKNKMETQESPPNRKSLSKLLLNGLSESNSRKTSDSKSQDYCLHSQESPTRIEHPLKIQKVPQLKRISFSQKSCPKILTVCLENLPVDRGQNMMEYKLNQKKSTPTQQADIIQSLQNISQTTQSVGQNLPHKLALLEKQLSNQTPLSSLLNLDQSLIPLTRQEKVPTSSSVLKQLLNKPFQNPGLDQSTIQTTLPSTINHLPKNIQCVSLEQVQKEPVSQINPQTNHIPDMKPPKANQVSTANQLRIHLVNIETLKSRHPSSLGKVQNNSVHATTNQNQSRKNSIKQEQKQTSQLLNLQTPKSRYLLNQDQVTGNLDHQPSLDQTQNSQVKQEQLQTTQLLPLQALKSKFHHQPQVQGNSLHQTHLDNSVKEEHLQATLLPLLQTPRSRSSHQEQIQTNLLHPPNLDQKQNHSIKHEQTSQLPSLQKLIGNSPSNQDQVPNTLIHNPYQEQEQNHTIKKNQSQIIQSPSLHLSQPPTCPENSPITMQTSNSDLSQKNCTQPVDSNLPQKQSNSQEAVEYNQKPSESCFKQPQKQPIKENVTVNQSHQLQKSHCNSFHVPNQEKQLARQEILQTSCSLKPLQSESNYTRSLNLGQTKNHQTNQENLLENQMEQEDNSKCSIQDPTQNQSANREKLQISLPLSLPPGQSILKHSGHIHSQLNTIVREKHRKTENYQLNDPCQENNHLQHISPEQELIHVIPEKLQPHSIPCQQQFPSHIQSPPLEQPQIPVSQHQSQDSLKVLHTIHSSNSDQSCKVMTNQGRQICHSPNPNRSQNSSCSLPKAPSLSPSLDKLQISRSIRNNLKTSSTHNSEKPSHQTCHSQNNVPLVSPKVGKVPCTLKKLPNLTISMEAEILPNLDKFQSSCTPSLSMETEPPSLEKLQARLWPGLEQADTVMDCNNQQLRKQKVVVDKTCQTVNSKDSLKSCLEKKSCCTTLEVMEQNENLVECDRIVAELEEVLQCNSDSKNEDVVVYRSGSCDSSCYENWKNVETASKNDDVEVLRNGISNMVTDENWKNLETAVENNEGDVLRNGMSNMATEENWKNVETEGENNEEVLRNGISDMVTDENWKNVETACKNDDGEVLKNDISNMVTDENWKNGETACKNDDGKALKNAISNMVTDENWKNVETACKNDDGEVLKNGISNMVTDENWKNVETACRNDDGEALKNAISNMVSDENWKNLETACKNDDGKNDDGEALKNAISNMVTDENWKNVEIACKNDDGEVSKNGISNMVIDENWKNVKTACKNDEEVLKNTISNMVTDENWKNVETACENDDGKVLTNGISNMATDENWKNVETACKNDDGKVLKNAISNMVTDENWKNVETACENDDGKVLKNGISNVVTDENWKNVETTCKNDDGEILRDGISNMFTNENWENTKTVSNTSEEIAQSETKSYDWLDIDSGIFSDLSENKPEELFFQSSMDCATSTGSVDMIENHLLEELPKNFNLTENIRTYTKKSRKALSVVNKDCIEALTGDDILNVCKNVNSVDSSSVDSSKLHSSVQHFLTKSKELKVVLRRLSSNEKMTGRSTPNMEEYCSIKNKCDRGKTPPKNSRRRRSTDKSENKVDGKAPNLVQNHGLSPLQDINLRPNPRVYSRAACCDLSVLNRAEDLKTQRVLTEQNPANRKSYAKSVLANIPGLNDFQMIKPLNVNHIVNVVQLSGGRPAQNVPLQSQTSTQVTPHIQRIGQPRISDQKPEHSNSVTSTIHTTTTTTTARTTTTQPSTLINILSQQIIRPVVTQANTVRRQTPLINILSQQIIRPSSTAKTANNSTVPVAETNQVKPVVTTEQTVINQVNNVVKNTTTTVKNTNPVTGGQGGTILQFICKSSLPKFQQAFGKTVYQNSTESSESVTATVETTGNSTIDPKKNVTKAVPVNVQPIQGSVIYSRQVPVGQTISLIPPGGTTRQVFRIATSNPEQISLVKDSVIHSKMSALLAAALQGRPKNADGDIQVNCDDGKGTITRPTLVQGARIVKPVQLQLQSNTARATPQPNLSSTTLEQLREFDMVYKQVKERSSTTTNETGGVAGENQEVTQQRISVTYVNQLQKYTQLSPVVVVTSYSSLQPAASPALSVTSQGSSSPCVTPASTPTLPKISSKTSKGKTLKTAVPNNTTPKSSPIPKPQQKPQEDEHTTQRIFDILAEYAEQLRNSPDLNNKPAPRRRSNPPTNPSQNSKRKKSSSGVKKSGHTSNSLEIDADDITVGSEDSSGGGMVQLSVTDDEQSQAATINTTESSDNSSPPSSRPLILTEGAAQSRNLIIADSSVGEALKMPNTAVIVPGSYIMPVSMVKGGQQIAVVSGGSKILATVPARSGQNMLVFQSFTNQHRKGAISAVKYSTIQPISGISSQSLAGVSAQPPVILPSNSVATAVALGQPLTLKKIGDDRDSNEQQLLLTISPSKEESKDSNDVPQPDSSTSVSSDSVDITIESDIKNETDNSRERIYQSYQKSVITNSAGTSVIATTSAAAAAVCNKEEDNTSQSIITSIPADNIKAEPKSGERIHSVLVTACSSNGPMLSHITPRYRKPSDTGRTNNNDLPNKEEFLHNGDKTSTDQKNFRTSATYYVNKMKKVNVDSQKLESEMQKQAAIERELRLQKSLSEECEDLGVDEPSTSDLFPEADLLFDSNHSPSFDQTSQDIMKRAPQSSDIKEEVKETMNLFSDDENSSSLRTDLFEYVEYQTVETALARQMMNGNNSAESGSSGCEDNTLLAKCATMSEVTLNSPISPEVYQESSLHKYKFKYSNRKKGERIKQSDFGEVVSSSEDTFGNAELTRINCEEDNFKVVHVAITKTDIVKEGETCQLHCDEDLDSPSGRGARRSVRKLCSCCNGSKDGNLAKKRPQTSRPHTPAVPHKKAFLNKKR